MILYLDIKDVSIDKKGTKVIKNHDYKGKMKKIKLFAQRKGNPNSVNIKIIYVCDIKAAKKSYWSSYFDESKHGKVSGN